MTFDGARLDAIVAERRLGLGHPSVFHEVTGSTNDDALEGARSGAPHGALYVAGAQTAGRGRRGNRWFGVAGESLAFTVLLRPNLAPSRASGLALVAGLAVRAAVERWLRAVGQTEPAQVKWPNDVVLGGRKLCGILAESQIRGTELSAVALGIGLNLGTGGLPEELSTTATSLEALGIRWESSELYAERLIADILGELEPRIAAFSAGGESTVEELRLHDVLYGRRVKVGEIEGIGAGINRSGSLLVKSANGAETEVVSGHVETPAT